MVVKCKQTKNWRCKEIMANRWDKIVRGGWLTILSKYTKDILLLSATYNHKNVCTFNKKEIKEKTGLNYNGIREAVIELENLGFIHRLNKKKRNKLEKNLKKKGIKPKEVILVFKSIPKLTPDRKIFLNHSYFKKYLYALVSKEHLEEDIIKEVKKKSETIKNQNKKYIYKLFYHFLKKRKKKQKRFKNIYDVVDIIVANKKEHENNKVVHIDSSDLKKKNLNKYEKEVIKTFEDWTQHKFDLEELPLLQESLKVCYPSMIKSGIKRTVSKTKKEINSFEYFYNIIIKGGFGYKPNKSKKKNDNQGGSTKDAEKDFWEEYNSAK
jgi:hypothetical protein